MPKLLDQTPFKVNKPRKRRRENKPLTGQKGVISLIAFLTLGVLLLLGSYFLSFTLVESRISESQKIAVKTYYLAEAGVNEAIWKLKNDPIWKDNFVRCVNYLEADCGDEICQDWSATFSKPDALFNGGSYTVSIQNSECAKGRIVSTATINLPGGGESKRVIKTTVFKAIASPIGKSAVFSGGTSENIDLYYTNLRVHGGNLSSNHNLNIKGWSEVRVCDDHVTEVCDNPDTPEKEGQVLAVGNLTGAEKITLYDAICAKDECITVEKCEKCPPDSIPMPLVDFDSENSDSFRSRAQAAQDLGQCLAYCNGGPCSSMCNGVLCSTKCVLTTSEFEKLLWEVGENGILSLDNVVTYVTGGIELRGGRRLIVNGVLVADGTLDIGERYSWKGDGGLSQVTINQPTETTPSGLLTKAKINFGLYSSFQEINIEGVIYAEDEMRLVSVPHSFEVIGGILARKLALTSILQWLDITFDKDKILYGLGYKIDSRDVIPTYSPIITIEHWEEAY